MIYLYGSLLPCLPCRTACILLKLNRLINIKPLFVSLGHNVFHKSCGNLKFHSIDFMNAALISSATILHGEFIDSFGNKKERRWEKNQPFRSPARTTRYFIVYGMTSVPNIAATLFTTSLLLPNQIFFVVCYSFKCTTRCALSANCWIRLSRKKPFSFAFFLVFLKTPNVRQNYNTVSTSTLIQIR